MSMIQKSKGRHRLKSALGVFAAFGLLAGVASSWAGTGLQTKFGLVTIENLELGQTYNTREIASLPLVIKNTGDERMTVKVEPLMPDPKSPSLVNNGYELIPDLSWVKVSKDELVIEPGSSEATDILITIPDDEKYLGKKFQVDFISRSVTKKFLAVALRSTVRFTIASRRLTEAEVQQRKKVSQFEKIDFDMLPNKALIENVPLGREVDIEKEFKTALKLSNPNDTDFLYYLDVVTFSDVEMNAPPEFEQLPVEMAKLGQKEVNVAENSIKKVKLTLNIPNEEKHRGKKYAFVVRGKVAGTPVEVFQTSRFFITTQK